MEGPSERLVVTINGRVHEIPAYRPATGSRLGGAEAWWRPLLLLGGLLLVLAGFVGADLGSEAAVGGVALFLATAVVAGTERYELATALGLAGVFWTAAGISVALRVDPSLNASLLGLALVGLVSLAAGVLSVHRSRLEQRTD